MQNNYLLTLPIKTLNKVAKGVVVQYNSDFTFLLKGVLYKENYFDFRVCKMIHNFKLVENSDAFDNVGVNLNQLTYDPVVVCAVFQNHFELYMFSLEKLQQLDVSESCQHNNNFFQLHGKASCILLKGDFICRID